LNSDTIVNSLFAMSSDEF